MMFALLILRTMLPLFEAELLKQVSPSNAWLRRPSTQLKKALRVGVF
jgi:hypothetical protein